MKPVILFFIVLTSSYAVYGQDFNSIKYQSIIEPTSIDSLLNISLTIENQLSQSNLKQVYVLVGDQPGGSRIKALSFFLNRDSYESQEAKFKRLPGSVQIKLFDLPRSHYITITLRTTDNQFIELISH